ncbi:MAG: bacillithiol biosynthesis BshC [Candidatus Thorarchaeota archaeon]|nr:bacillithiol biosynthesis BshC [Candidatus Thorarchaeota archaeon]
MDPSVTNVYQNFIWNGTMDQLASELYDTPVLTLGSVRERALQILEGYDSTNWHSDERRKKSVDAIVDINRRLGALTPDVREGIERLFDGAIEAAHQSVVMGGPGYVLNKVATAKRIALLNSDEEHRFGSFFCVADYDIVQTELTNIRTPNMGSGGTLISLPVSEEYQYSPVSVIPLPPISWYSQVEEEIRSNYHPILKMLEAQARALVEERLEQALSVVRWAYVNSKTLGEWAMRILGRLFNIEGNLGIPLVPASDPAIRGLLVQGFELLLSEENRNRFLQAYNDSTDTISANGMSPGSGRRDDSYVPFFYECSNNYCNRARTELYYSKRGQFAVLSGKCPHCGEKIEIETHANSPSLSAHAEWLSPRVDSRQIVIDTLLPVVSHVGGSGETAYYAQVIPAARSLGIPFPMFMKYPRVYFNTPWNEALAKQLLEKGLTPLQRPEMFKAAGKIGRCRKKNSFQEMNEAIKEFGEFIIQSHAQLKKELRQKSTEIEEASTEELQFTRLEIERYLSWAYGEYTEDKMGQEVSWSWIEWALNSGFIDLFGPYDRAYVGEMKNGATVFVNFVL